MDYDTIHGLSWDNGAEITAYACPVWRLQQRHLEGCRSGRHDFRMDPRLVPSGIW